MSWPTKQGVYTAERKFKAGKHYKVRKILEKTYADAIDPNTGKKYDAATRQRAVYYWLHTFAMTHAKGAYYNE